MKTAFLFPGQGAQFVGMGRDVAERFPAAADVYDRANDIAGFDLKTICFEGPADVLNTTAVSQPAIFVTSAAILAALQSRRTAPLKPDITGGLSLGEYTALYAAGAVDFESALRLVLKRGQAMQAAAEQQDGGMVSLIGVDPEQAQALCERAAEADLLELANFNCPGQIVISGGKAACRRALALADEYGAAKAVMLEVAGAFHTPMMQPAADALRQALAETSIDLPADPRILANVTGQTYSPAEDPRPVLVDQLVKPVRWQSCMERLLAEDVQTILEIGPGKVLTGLMRRIQRRAPMTPLNSAESLEAFLAQTN